MLANLILKEDRTRAELMWLMTRTSGMLLFRW